MKVFLNVLQMQGFNCRGFGVKRDVNVCLGRVGTRKISRMVSTSVSGDSGASVEYDVPFPSDYSQLLEQVSFYFSYTI